MAKLFDFTLKPCKCGKEPKMAQWEDTKKPNATWIECECGMITLSFYSKDPELAKKKAVKMWNKTAKKRVRVKNGLKSCEKCGSRNVKIFSKKLEFTEINFIHCEDCGLFTDEMKPDGGVRTLDEAKELWNS